MSDVFSLGCTFIEMFTVLKGRRVRDLTSILNANGITPYRDSILELGEWMNNLHSDDETYLKDTIDQMIHQDPDGRLSIAQVFENLKTCGTIGTPSFCGSFCRD